MGLGEINVRARLEGNGVAPDALACFSAYGVVARLIASHQWEVGGTVREPRRLGVGRVPGFTGGAEAREPIRRSLGGSTAGGAVNLSAICGDRRGVIVPIASATTRKKQSDRDRHGAKVWHDLTPMLD